MSDVLAALEVGEGASINFCRRGRVYAWSKVNIVVEHVGGNYVRYPLVLELYQ